MPGVSCVLLWHSSDSKAGPQALENLMKKIELLGAVRAGRIHVEGAIYFTTNSRPMCKTFQVLTSTEYPASCFILTDSHTLLVADIAFREFPGYMKSSYQLKKKLHVEAKGVKYKLGDFGINFLTLFMGQSATVRGYLVEVTFEASCVLHQCVDLLRTFITQNFPDICSPTSDSAAVEQIFSPSFHRAIQTGSLDTLRWPPNQVITPDLPSSPSEIPLIHSCVRLTMIQYAEHMNTVRRLSRLAPNPTLGTSSNSSSNANTPSVVMSTDSGSTPTQTTSSAT